jgi:hypothetical protein
MRTAMIEQFHHKSVRAMLDGLSYITTTGEGQTCPIGRGAERRRKGASQ